MKPSGVRVAMLSLGGILGVNARYWLGVWMSGWTGAGFPWATLIINVSGCLAIGFLSEALMRWLPHPNVRLMVVTGFLGGYTTFSTFAFESSEMWERGEIGGSVSYMTASLVAGFGAVASGIMLARVLASLVSRETAGEVMAEVGSEPRDRALPGASYAVEVVRPSAEPADEREGG